MEIKLRTTRGPSSKRVPDPCTVSKEGTEENETTSKGHGAKATLKATDHGLDEKNLLGVFSTLFKNLTLMDSECSELPCLSLLSRVISLLEGNYRPHMAVLVKSQVETAQRSS